ncbi:MAG TPA: SIR2 family protein, partial [Chloroflexota bacterium]|nr:SIR2 family protein [Chloroflexota bacterium]
MAINVSRRRMMQASQTRLAAPTDTFFEQRCRAIHRQQLIPIIGDTIRLAHIFDANAGPNTNGDESVGVQTLVVDELEGEGASNGHSDLARLSVTEELAQYWAQEISYPLADRYRIARVAQFHILEQENSVTAKEDYLSFLKSLLLEIARDIAQEDGDREELAYIDQLKNEPALTFSDIVAELDYPQFPPGKEDPLRVLARLPLKIYLTTSYYNSVERELEAAGKYPKSRLCFWNGRPPNLSKEHEPDPNYTPDVNNPVVYHLFGMEQYPQSLVLSEDDYLDFLWTLARDLPGDSGERIIPPYLQAELNNSSLLLLGFRLGDWDLRVLFRGLLSSGPGLVQRRLPGTAIQIEVGSQPLVEDEEKAAAYLKEYFKQARLDVRYGDSDQFVTDLW